jgi:hypothetical protein
MPQLILLIASFRRDHIRSRAFMQAEILALRHQLGIYQRTTKRVRIRPADRLFWSRLFRVEKYYFSGDKSWTLNDPYERIILRLTADPEDGSQDPGASGAFTQTMGPWDNSQTQEHELDLASGESLTFEISKDDAVTEIGFSTTSGRLRVEYLVDLRAGSPATPAFPDKLK